MRSPARRLVSLGLALLLVAGLGVTSTLAAAPAEATLVAAEGVATTKINEQRVDRGLVKLRVDSRLAALARERAVYMAENDIFSHTHAGGQAVWDLMSANGITWYGAGEIIAYNTTSSLSSSAAGAVKQWMASPPHKAIIVSKSYNYFGVGVAVSPNTGRRYWAGVFLKGPDRTGAWAKITSTTKKSISATRSKVTFRWTGGDTQLQVLTSGFHSYQFQRRMDGGPWYDYGTTTKTTMTRTWIRGSVYEFRVRARDRNGNWSSWKTVKVRP
jgi:uncharacterized protein YkwD